MRRSSAARSRSTSVCSRTRSRRERLLRRVELLEDEAERRLESRQVIGVTVIGRDESRLHAEGIELSREALRGREEIEVVVSSDDDHDPTREVLLHAREERRI